MWAGHYGYIGVKQLVCTRPTTWHATKYCRYGGKQQSINQPTGGRGGGFRAKITLNLNTFSDKPTGNKICRVGWGMGLLKSDRVLALRETSFPIGPK